MERIEKLRKCGMTIFYWLVKCYVAARGWRSCYDRRLDCVQCC